MDMTYSAREDAIWKEGELIPKWEQGGITKFYEICHAAENDPTKPYDERCLMAHIGHILLAEGEPLCVGNPLQLTTGSSTLLEVQSS
jgi:hypothetical protein